MNAIWLHRVSVGRAPSGIPGPGQTFRDAIPNDERGIRFEVGKMREYVRHFSGDRLVVQTARRVIQLCPAKDKTCEMQALWRWAKDHMRYVNDPEEKELLTTPVLNLQEIMTPPEVIRRVLGDDLIRQMSGFGIGHALLEADARKTQLVCRGCFRTELTGLKPTTSGDCDEAATFLATLLASVGIKPRFRFGGSEDSRAMDGCNYHHVWVQGQDETGNWIDMDITEPKKPFGWFFEGFGCTGVTEIF